MFYALPQHPQALTGLELFSQCYFKYILIYIQKKKPAQRRDTHIISHPTASDRNVCFQYLLGDFHENGQV